MPTINLIAPDYKPNTTKLVGLLNDQVILEWNSNPKFSPAKNRVATLPLSGGEIKAMDLGLNGQQMPSYIFEDKIAVSYLESFKPQRGFILSGKNITWLSSPNNDKKTSIQSFKIDENGVYGTARTSTSMTGCLWDFQGNVIETRSTYILGAYNGQLITEDFKVNLLESFGSSRAFAVRNNKVFVFGFLAGKPQSTANSKTFIYDLSTNQLSPLFTGNWDHVRPLSYSKDGRYVIGIAVNFAKSNNPPSQDNVLVDTMTDTLVSMTDLVGLPMGQAAFEFDESSILCTIWDESKNAVQLVQVKDWAY